MTPDQFDERVGAELRGEAIPAPAGLWADIEARLPPERRRHVAGWWWLGGGLALVVLFAVVGTRWAGLRPDGLPAVVPPPLADVRTARPLPQKPATATLGAASDRPSGADAPAARPTVGPFRPASASPAVVSAALPGATDASPAPSAGTPSLAVPTRGLGQRPDISPVARMAMQPASALAADEAESAPVRATQFLPQVPMRQLSWAEKTPVSFGHYPVPVSSADRSPWELYLSAAVGPAQRHGFVFADGLSASSAAEFGGGFSADRNIALTAQSGARSGDLNARLNGANQHGLAGALRFEAHHRSRLTLAATVALAPSALTALTESTSVAGIAPVLTVQRTAFYRPVAELDLGYALPLGRWRLDAFAGAIGLSPKRVTLNAETVRLPTQVFVKAGLGVAYELTPRLGLIARGTYARPGSRLTGGLQYRF